MLRIKIDPNRLNDLSAKTRNIENKTNECKESVGTVINRLDWEVSSKASINTRLNKVQKRLQRQSELMDAYEKVLGTTNDNFRNKATKLMQDAKSIIYKMNSISAVLSSLKTPISKISYSTDEKLRKLSIIETLFGKETIESTGKWVWETLKKAGYAGALIALGDGIIGGVIKGDKVKLAKTAYAGWKSIRNLSKDIKNMGMVKRILHPDTIKTSWKNRIFGLTDYFTKVTGKASHAKSFKTRFYNNFQKAGRKEISKVAWSSFAISGIFNSISNKQEYDSGKITAERAVAETIVETGVDTAVDIVVTSAIAAAVGAAAVGLGCTVAAPGVVVAAGVIGVKMGLDAVTTWATGSDSGFTEVVSDGIIDGATAIGKGVAKAAGTVGDCISSFGKSITPKWKFSFGF